MDRGMAYADCALDAWASWAKRNLLYPWPIRTLLGRLIDEGAGACVRAAKEDQMPEGIAAVDRAVCAAPQTVKTVLLVYYLEYADFDQKAKWLGLSRQGMKMRLENSQRWIYLHLSSQVEGPIAATKFGGHGSISSNPMPRRALSK